MKKIIAIILILVTIFSVTSCGDREYDEAIVLAEAKRLIPETVLLNDIFWGKGIDYIEDLNTASGYYYMADPLYLIINGFETIDELKEMTREVYSTSYCESIFSAVFDAANDPDEGFVGLVRYYQKYSDAEMKEPECIMVYSRAIVLLGDEVEYLYDTMKVTGSKKEKVYVSLSVKVTRGDKSQIREISVGLIEEKDIGWRIDTPTYITYYEEPTE